MLWLEKAELRDFICSYKIRMRENEDAYKQVSNGCYGQWVELRDFVHSYEIRM